MLISLENMDKIALDELNNTKQKNKICDFLFKEFVLIIFKAIV